MRRAKDDPSASSSAPIQIELDGEPIPARAGEPVAASLLAAGHRVFARSVKYHRPRGPFCMTGGCSQCLMRVDGVPNVYTCQVPARPGMKLERQNAYPSAEHDVFGAIDWLFPRGLDHHEIFAGVPIAEKLMTKVARHLAGLGDLPEGKGLEVSPPSLERPEVAIVGGGPAGLAAARELSRAGAPFLLLERAAFLGGRLVTGPGAPRDPPLSAFAGLPEDSLRLHSVVIGLFEDAEGRYLAAVQRREGRAQLCLVRPERFLLAPGGNATVLPFEGNDLPGVFSGRAVSLLVRRARVFPGSNYALVGSGPELYALAALLEREGQTVKAVVDLAGPPPADAPGQAVHGLVLKAHGRTGVRGLTLEVNGRPRKVACDAVAVCLPVAPAFELCRQGGAKVAFSAEHGAFVVEADDDGRTARPDLFAAGEVTAQMGAGKAADMGARAARALLGGPR
jgi:sarcosine oxidase, subunit alpha